MNLKLKIMKLESQDSMIMYLGKKKKFTKEEHKTLTDIKFPF